MVASIFDRILVPLDGSLVSEQALPYVAALAEPTTELQLIQVVSAPAPILGFGVSVHQARDQLYQESLKAVTDYIEAMAASVHDLASVAQVTTAVETGDPAAEILDAARRLQSSLIVMTSRGRGALGRFAFGSVADRVSRTAEVPVLIVAPLEDESGASAPAVRRLVLPLDGSERAATALPIASALAKRHAIPIQVVSVVDLFRVAASTTSGELFQLVVTDMREGAGQVVNAAVAQLAKEQIAAHGTVVEGSPADSIAGLVQAGDVIVLTSHGRGGIRRWLLGSVAEKLVHSGIAPVLLVRSAPSA